MCERDRTAEASASAAGVPRFYRQRPRPDSLRGKLMKEARLRLLQARHSMVLDNSHLDQVWYTLHQHVSGCDAAGEGRMTYQDFCEAAAACQEAFGDAMGQFFRASTFLRLERDCEGRISLRSLFHYIMRRNAMLQTRVHLSCFDEDGRGWLSEEQLRAFVGQALPQLPALQGMEEHMDAETYARLAVRKFVVLLARRHRMKIRHLLPSTPLAELLELREPAGNATEAGASWFSLASMAGVLSQFRDLDVDGNGSLSQAEFQGFSGGTMSAFFISRLFAVRAAGAREGAEQGDGAAGEMGLTAFADFLVAWEHRATPAGVAYFFPMLDLHGRGYLTQVDVFAFLRAVYELWLECGQLPLSMEDVKDEIWDMVKPADPLRLTAQDLIASSMAGTVINILADVNLFWEHDERENLLQGGGDAAAEELPDVPASAAA